MVALQLDEKETAKTKVWIHKVSILNLFCCLVLEELLACKHCLTSVGGLDYLLQTKLFE